MDVIQDNLERLAVATRWNYRAGAKSASEPAAWAAIAMAAYDRKSEALRPAAWLAGIQQLDGSVGIAGAEPEPRWPTSLAILAWRVVDVAMGYASFDQHIEHATTWSLSDHGKTAPNSPHVGHDSTLSGWSWAAGTHSWLEPTCFFVVALSAIGRRAHARTQEGLRLVRDRLLPSGGANYGNTIVLGQELLPHVLPTGLAMLALAGDDDADVRVGRSLEYLNRSIDAQTAPLSFAWACLGLAAHGRRPAHVEEWTATILRKRDETQLGTLERSLLLLAALPDASWMPRGDTIQREPSTVEAPA